MMHSDGALTIAFIWGRMSQTKPGPRNTEALDLVMTSLRGFSLFLVGGSSSVTYHPLAALRWRHESACCYISRVECYSYIISLSVRSYRFIIALTKVGTTAKYYAPSTQSVLVWSWLLSSRRPLSCFSNSLLAHSQ